MALECNLPRRDYSEHGGRHKTPRRNDLHHGIGHLYRVNPHHIVPRHRQNQCTKPDNIRPDRPAGKNCLRIIHSRLLLIMFMERAAFIRPVDRPEANLGNPLRPPPAKDGPSL